MNQPLVTWTLWIVGALLGVGALSLCVWALFLDRSRGRLRCPKCWYTLDAHTAQRCPECGNVPKRIGQLRRTRRRYVWALAGVVLGVIAYVTAVTPDMLRGGWRRGIPSTLLVTVWPIDLDAWLGKHLDSKVSNDPDVAELDRRFEERELRRWHERLWVWRLERHLAAQKRLGIRLEQPVIEQLDRARVTWEFRADPLEKVLGELSKRIGVPIRPDWNSLIPEGIGPQSIVSARLVEESGADALTAIMRTAGAGLSIAPAWYVRGSEVCVGVYDADSADVPHRLYDVGALVLGREELWRSEPDLVHPVPDRVAGLASIFESLIDPDDWSAGGGDRACTSVIGTYVVIRAPATHHVRVASIIEALATSCRVTGSVASVDPAEWDVITRAADSLASSRIELSGSPVRLDDLIASISSASGIPADVDWEALAAINIRPSFQIDTVRTALTCEQALDRFVKPLVPDVLNGVSWTIHRGVLRISTKGHDSLRRCIRVYNIMNLIAPPEWSTPAPRPVNDGEYPEPPPWPMDSARALCRTIFESVEQESWYEAGGDVGQILQFGPCLIIQTTARNHLRIEALLNQLRQGPPARGFSVPSTEKGEELDEDGDPVPLDAEEPVSSPR